MEHILQYAVRNRHRSWVRFKIFHDNANREIDLIQLIENGHNSTPILMEKFMGTYVKF
jgi:hypothetical protein